MTPEGTGGRKFTELVTHHGFGDVEGDVLTSVMNRDSVTYHFWKNG
jgi:hypothetical protein